VRLLLDTCTFLWIASGSTQLSRRAAQLFSDPANEVFLSAVSAWEIAVKYSRIPSLHRDPFDRMLVCQAVVNGMALLTPDPLISQYPIRAIW
jgi:PIN domain nuclease of toxin-antitoxin system